MATEMDTKRRFVILPGMNATLEETKMAYDERASYWHEISDNSGYKGHILCVEAFDRAMQSADVYPNPRKDMKILDAGAGTGAIGEMLKARGYTNVDALDISQEMLNLAAPKNLYKKLICAPLKDTYMKEVETAEYDVVLCAGTIVYGQVKPGALEQCARFVKPGGLFIFSIRVDSYDPEGLGYSDKCEELEKTGKWSLVQKEKRELHATPQEERYRYCYLITYKILK
ncbi:methyltransferase-like protein 27 [Oculina patagonica]